MDRHERHLAVVFAVRIRIAHQRRLLQKIIQCAFRIFLLEFLGHIEQFADIGFPVMLLFIGLLRFLNIPGIFRFLHDHFEKGKDIVLRRSIEKFKNESAEFLQLLLCCFGQTGGL